MITKSWRSKIISTLRQMTRYYPPIKKAREKSKIGPETHKCPLCQMIIYTGARSIEAIRLKYPDAVEGKIVIDHISPIVRIDGQESSWDEIINNMFCDEDNLQAICKTCHDSKTMAENQERKENKRKRNKELDANG